MRDGEGEAKAEAEEQAQAQPVSAKPVAEWGSYEVMRAYFSATESLEAAEEEAARQPEGPNVSRALVKRVMHVQLASRLATEAMAPMEGRLEPAERAKRGSWR